MWGINLQFQSHLIIALEEKIFVNIKIFVHDLSLSYHMIPSTYLSNLLDKETQWLSFQTSLSKHMHLCHRLNLGLVNPSLSLQEISKGCAQY